MNNNISLDCAIVGDLLPLYHDDVVSDTTKAAVESHLDGCESCRTEYEALCAELPIGTRQDSTGKRFSAMMKRQKIKKILSIVLPILLAVAILITGYSFLLDNPIVSMDEQVSTPLVYRYETEAGIKFFILFVHPMYDGALESEAHTEYTKDGAALYIEFDRPMLVTRVDDEPSLDVFVYDFQGSPGGAPSCAEVTEVYLGGQVIWSEAKNGGDVVPDYVYEHDRFDGTYIETWDVDYDENDPSKCTMTAGYNDGRTVIWDFDGNIISVIPAEI